MYLIRTFSKAYALAGARVGYALCREEIAIIIDTVSEPFNANRVGIAGALATLQKDMKECAEAISKIRAMREQNSSDAFDGSGSRSRAISIQFYFRNNSPLTLQVVSERLCLSAG